MDSSTFFGLSTVAYILAMMTYITYLAFRKTTIGIIATAITVTGFISQTLALGMRWKEFSDIGQMGILRAVPLTNLYESLIFFVWCLILAYLVIEFKYKNRSFGSPRLIGRMMERSFKVSYTSPISTNTFGQYVSKSLIAPPRVRGIVCPFR